MKRLVQEFIVRTLFRNSAACWNRGTTPENIYAVDKWAELGVSGFKAKISPVVKGLIERAHKHGLTVTAYGFWI